MPNKKSSKFPYDKFFENNGHRLTEPRKAIIEVLDNNSGHITTEDIYFKVHENNPSIGLTTVYRTIDLLTGWGLIKRFDIGDGKARYQLKDFENNNGHSHLLYCNKCKKIIDYSEFLSEEIEILEKLQEKLSHKYNFEINNHFVQFQGWCKECKENNN